MNLLAEKFEIVWQNFSIWSEFHIFPEMKNVKKVTGVTRGANKLTRESILFHFLSHFSTAYTHREIINYDIPLPYKCKILPNIAILKKKIFRKIRREINSVNFTCEIISVNFTARIKQFLLDLDAVS